MSDLSQYSNLLTPGLIAIVGWFLKRSVEKILKEIEVSSKKINQLDTKLLLLEKDITRMNEHIVGMKHIKDEWILIKSNLDQMMIEVRNAKTLFDDLAVLKRDQVTMWKKLDAIKTTSSN